MHEAGQCKLLFVGVLFELEKTHFILCPSRVREDGQTCSQRGVANLFEDRFSNSIQEFQQEYERSGYLSKSYKDDCPSREAH